MEEERGKTQALDQVLPPYSSEGQSMLLTPSHVLPHESILTTEG